jgi:UDPglucose 6-dehydrogenase
MRRFLSAAKVKIDYVSNPEFLREGRAVYDWFNPDRIVVGGDDEEAVNRVLELYRDIEASKVVTSVASAEMVKYASNAFLATKISFINEIANLCELIDANVEEVATAVGLDKRIGGDFLKAGLGYGGSCFPKDTRGLDYLAAFNGYDFRLLKAVIEVNSRQWIRALSKLRSRLDGLYGRKICVLGLTFKPETDDLRDAPALNIINQLVNEGAQVKACDPVSWRKASAVLPQGVQTYPEPYQAVTGCEAVVLATEWSHFRSADWGVIKGLMAEPHLVVDGRNALDQQALAELGFEYCGVGRTESPARDLSQKNRNRM